MYKGLLLSGTYMQRREFIAGLGSAAAWTTLARAQQPERKKRIGVLQSNAETDPEGRSNLTTFVKNLDGLGWTVGRNLIIDYRWANGDVDRARSLAKELLSATPDVILATGTAAVAVLREQTHTVPVVFARVTGPIELGFVASFARPGGNVTGFINFDYSIGGKWLQTLKEIAPDTRRVVVIGNPDSSTLDGYFRSIAADSLSLAVEPVRAAVRNLEEITRAISGSGEGGGLIVVPDAFTLSNRAVLVAQAMQQLVPAIYPFRFFAAEGGLVSYGINTNEQYVGAARYVDRVLKGEKPANLPVQQPTKFELVINLKTAKALGLTVPPSLLARADEVIE